MQTKLTLRLDEKLIRRAKKTSARNGKSVSQLVADFFATLDENVESSANASNGSKTKQNERNDVSKVMPMTASLIGVIKSTVDISDYRDYLDQKHSK